MADLKSGILLAQDEKLVFELEAELWATSSNPIARAVGEFKKAIAGILGFKRQGYLVITDKRVVEVLQMKACFTFNQGKVVKYILPSSVKEVGYVKEGTCCGCFCQSYKLYYEAFTQVTSVLLPDADEAEAQKVVDAFYKAIAKAQ